MASTTTAITATPPASINANDHGPQIIITGGIMLSALILMVAIAVYNRYIARTIFHVDSIMMLFGATLDVGFFTLYAVAVQAGFGRHTRDFTSAHLTYLRHLYLGTLFMFFISHGTIKISYNLLARRTARSRRFQLYIDIFSVVIGLWTLSNIIVIAAAFDGKWIPKPAFFYISGSASILIITGQLLAFLWIIWHTTAKRNVKIRWSFSMGAFVPLCIACIVTRLVYLPSSFFHGDWTFTDVPVSMLFLVELNIVTMTVLAPNLPVFFHKTSTGGVYFLPGEAVGGPRGSVSRSVKSPHVRVDSHTLSNGMQMFDGGIHDGSNKSHHVVTVQNGNGFLKPNSLDSDAILIRRSIEVETVTSDTPPGLVMSDTLPGVVTKIA